VGEVIQLNKPQCRYQQKDYDYGLERIRVIRKHIAEVKEQMQKAEAVGNEERLSRLKELLKHHRDMEQMWLERIQHVMRLEPDLFQSWEL